MGHWHTYRVTALLMATVMVAILGPINADGPPKITNAPSNMKVAEGNHVNFFCQASGSPAPAFNWERNGRRINSRRARFEITEAPHMSSLRIKDVKADKDNVTFTCVAHNHLGEARADAKLHIYRQKEGSPDLPAGYPKIDAQPKLRSIEKDHNALLQCEVSGNPKPSITWLKDKLPIDTTDPRIKITESGYLSISRTQESDEATYECVAENIHGTVYSYGAMIYVKVRRIAPKFTRVPEDVVLKPAGDLNLTCVAVGSPMPFVRWRQGARYLTPDNEDAPIGKTVLKLVNVVQSKNFTCEASSDLGNIEHDVQVIVEGE
ncbi:receptor tyrosine phosphatase [Plakobranchus ocellatus]|uniref:protein-tyrosine-phosphatase n=1 Tax=Plakobranchus ocellatus TaxID=259542 RepID=A0AAV3ZR70_9GAST|nr:receptor tyrosine phosphatase [Plakobranchus ocellatus]